VCHLPSQAILAHVQVAGRLSPEEFWERIAAGEQRTEPWGQTVARLQSSEGAIIGLSYAPSLHS
jgi:hypothetical protein